MITVFKYCLISLLFSPLTCMGFCDNYKRGLHLNTYHSDRSANYNENNRGEYLMCEGGVIIGYYLNSERTPSNYVGVYKTYGYVSISLVLLNGYGDSTIIGVLPSISIPGTPLSLVYLPQAPNKNNDTTGWHITIQTSFK